MPKRLQAVFQETKLVLPESSICVCLVLTVQHRPFSRWYFNFPPTNNSPELLRHRRLKPVGVNSDKTEAYRTSLNAKRRLITSYATHANTHVQIANSDECV